MGTRDSDRRHSEEGEGADQEGGDRQRGGRYLEIVSAERGTVCVEQIVHNNKHAPLSRVGYRVGDL